ncbi:MAG: MFS transporter [Thermoguttaceae bacterium]
MSNASAGANAASNDSSKVWSIRFLLFIAGLGGLLYGIDVGIIAGALPYLEATSGLDAQQLSFIVAAVLVGSVLSSLFAGMLSDLLGRRSMMVLSGALFVASIPIIALSSGYTPLLLGRLLQGVSGGLIGVVVPLYLAECLPARNRGSGTAIFQWLLTLGLVVAALIGLYYAKSVEAVEAAAKGSANVAAEIFQAKEHAWRSIFWMSISPGIVFCLGSLMIAESARWLFRRGKKEAALASLLRTRSRADADVEMREMTETAAAAHQRTRTARSIGGDSLLRRKYVLPFVIACIVLACTQATGVNSILAYVVNILNQAGLPGSVANTGDVSIKILNCLMTVVAVILVDRVGRKFLLALGSGGIVVCLGLAGFLFLTAEHGRTDNASVFRDVKSMVATSDYEFSVGTAYLEGTRGLKENKIKAYAWLNAWLAKAPAGRTTKAIKAKLGAIKAEFDSDDAKAAENLGKELDQALVVLFDEQLLAKAVGKEIASFPKTEDQKPMAQVSFVWSYGPFTGVQSRRCDAIDNQAIEVYRSGTVQEDNVLEAFFRKLSINPFADPAAGRSAPLEIKKAMIGPVPSVGHGWLVAICLFGFMAFFALGPGVCVWLALSELMPTRIRSNGMSIALLLNQFVSATIAAVFLPTVGNYGYAAMFFFWSGCTVIYFLTAVFLLPETKGKTLEEIEEHFSA